MGVAFGTPGRAGDWNVQKATVRAVGDTRRVGGLTARLAVSVAAVAALVVASTPHSGASGASWTVSPLTIASGYWGGPISIACPSPTGCVAVGWTIGPESNAIGGTWAASASVEAAGTWSRFAAVTTGAHSQQGQLESVSCWATGHCVAVGVAPLVPSGARRITHLIAYELDGSTWTALAPPRLPSHAAGGVSVACVGSGTCRVVGPVSTSARGATVRAYVATLLAGRWSTTSFIVPPNTFDLGSISCSSTTRCAALLVTESTGAHGRTIQHSYVEWMSKSVWHRTMPKGWGDLDAKELECPTPTTCVAVGLLQSGNSILSRQASGWGSADVVPDGDDAVSASCASSGCVVAFDPPFCADCGPGSPRGSGGVLRLQVKSWTQTSVPTPQGMLNVLPRALSCDPAQCTFAGTGEVPVPNEAHAFYDLPLVATLSPVG
jgi:hypothetical protein